VSTAVAISSPGSASTLLGSMRGVARPAVRKTLPHVGFRLDRPPELAAIAPPSSWQRGPRAHGSVGPERSHATAVPPPSSAVVRTLSTRGRDLPPRDPPPSVHPVAGREGHEHLDESHDATAALVPLARAAAKAFGDRNAAVDVNHAIRRLADVKARFGMSDTELEQYVRVAPDQPGLFRAGFPFGAAFCPTRVQPWLQRHRPRRQVAPQLCGTAEFQALSASELASRGTAVLVSLGERSQAPSCPGAGTIPSRDIAQCPDGAARSPDTRTSFSYQGRAPRSRVST
jgi:hypothetical protein